MRSVPFQQSANTGVNHPHWPLTRADIRVFSLLPGGRQLSHPYTAGVGVMEEDTVEVGVVFARIGHYDNSDVRAHI
jgi:hypothetical protein